MENNRNSFIFFRSFADVANEYELEDRNELLTAIINYSLDGIEPVFTKKYINASWKQIKPAIDANRIKWEKKQKAGKKGGLKKSENIKEQKRINEVLVDKSITPIIEPLIEQTPQPEEKVSQIEEKAPQIEDISQPEEKIALSIEQIENTSDKNKMVKHIKKQNLGEYDEEIWIEKINNEKIINMNQLLEELKNNYDLLK